MGPAKRIKSEYHRNLVLELCHGADYFLQLEILLDFICTLARTEEACLYLIKNKLTGKALLQFWKLEHGGSMLAVVQHINQALEKSDEIRNVIAGKDVI